MKISVFPLSLAMLLSLIVSAQNKTVKVIQINASVDALGNIKLMSLENIGKGKKDSAIDVAKLNKLVLESQNAIGAINTLAKEGWYFVSAVTLNKDENGRPNSPFIAYYFRKEE